MRRKRKVSLLHVVQRNRGNFDAVELGLVLVEAPNLEQMGQRGSISYLYVLLDAGVDARLELDLLEVGGRHVQQFV